MVCGITTYGAFTNIESMKPEEFFLKNTILLCTDLWKEKLLCVSRIARVFLSVLNKFHSFVKLCLRDADCVAEIKCIKMIDFSHNNHNVVCWLVIDKKFSIAVINHTTGREYDIVEESIVVSTTLIFFTCQLKKSQPSNVA